MRIFLKHLYRDFRAAPIYPLLVLLTLLFAVAVTVTASALQGKIETHAAQVIPEILNCFVMVYFPLKSRVFHTPSL